MPKKETKAIVKHKTYNNSPVIGKNAGELFENEDEKKAFNSKALSESMEYFNVPIVRSTDEFIDRAEDYFSRCIQRGIKPTWEEFALAMGTTRATLWDWETGRRATVDADAIKKIKEIMASFDAKSVSEGKLNPVTYIFRSKNFYGMKDQQEHILTPNAGEAVDAKTLLDEAELLPEDE